MCKTEQMVEIKLMEEHPWDCFRYLVYDQIGALIVGVVGVEVCSLLPAILELVL